ncbi:MAG TPA: hypothetical protein VIL74_24425 [Pyrinomonadaceae bacterium]|jgi:hypothetical protein
MIAKREKEWQELESKARKSLSNLDLLPKGVILKFYAPVLRLWTYPSFEPYKVWIFSEARFQTIRVRNLKIIRAVWDQNEDYRRLCFPLEGLKKGFHTDPSIVVQSIERTPEVFDRIFAELKRIQFPAFANYEKSIGIDGVRYGIETFDFTHQTNISWWSVYPEEWQDLVDWFEKTVDFLETEFSKTDEG